MYRNLVSLVPQLLDHGIVGVLMGHIESAMDWAPVRVFVVGWEQFVLVERPVLVIDSIVRRSIEASGLIVSFISFGME